jgi:hypothetical protein
MNRIFEEILDVLAEANKAMSSQEITDELRNRGIRLEPRTVRYHLGKMESLGFIKKSVNGKRKITEKGIEELRRRSVFERLGEFSERIEYNVYFCTFDIFRMRGTVPTNIAIIDKNLFDRAIEIIKEVSESKLLISRLISVGDEGQKLGGVEIPDGKFGIAVISNTLYDVLMRNAGVSVTAEYAGLLHWERDQPKGFTELISYAGTTLSPGWLFIKSGLTSVFEAVKGSGEIITAIRSFSRYATDIVREEVARAESKGIRGVISISYPSDRFLSLPPGNRARLIVSAGLNYLSPLHEVGIDIDLRINEGFVEYTEFEEPEKIA